MSQERQQGLAMWDYPTSNAQQGSTADNKVIKWGRPQPVGAFRDVLHSVYQNFLLSEAVGYQRLLEKCHGRHDI